MTVKLMHLAIEYHPTTIEQPTSIAILDESKVVGIISIEEFDRTAEALKVMRDRYNSSRKKFNLEPHP